MLTGCLASVTLARHEFVAPKKFSSTMNRSEAGHGGERAHAVSNNGDTYGKSWPSAECKFCRDAICSDLNDEFIARARHRPEFETRVFLKVFRARLNFGICQHPASCCGGP